MTQTIPSGFKQTKAGIFVPGYVEERDLHISFSTLSAYEAHLRRAGKSDATIEKYTHTLRNFILWLGDRCLSVGRVRQWAEEQLKVRAVTTVNGALAALNGMFRYMERKDCVMAFYKVQEPQYRKEERCLTKEDLQKMLAHADDRLRTILLTFYGTGIRVSELKFFTVEAAAQGRVIVRNKGKIRTVFLPPETQQVLMDYAARAGIQGGILFHNRAGKPLSRGYIWRVLKAVAREANVPESKVFPHNLRHLFALERYQIDRDMEGLRQDLGHSLVTTTQRYLKETLTEHLEKLKHLYNKNHTAQSDGQQNEYSVA